MPAAIRWPGRIPRGSIDRRLATNTDLAATILAAAGVEQPHARPLDGRDLLDPTWRRDHVYFEFWQDRRRPRPWRTTWRAVRTRSWHYIAYYAGGRVVFRELYDLARDRFELDNVLAVGPAPPRGLVRELHARLEAVRRCAGASCP